MGTEAPGEGFRDRVAQILNGLEPEGREGREERRGEACSAFRESANAFSSVALDV